MSDLARTPEVRVSPGQLDSIRALYDQGLYLQSYRLAEAIAPLHLWRGAEARILAGRIAGNVGSRRLADLHFIHAWRGERQHPEALWYHARYLLSARGPYPAWRFMTGVRFPSNAPQSSLSHWYSLHATVLGMLRDFDRAEDWLHKADALGAEPWTLLEWASLYSLEDRFEDAERAVARALELHPWYRPAVQWQAHFLVQRERDEEALALLTEAAQRLESGAIHAQLAVLQLELKHYDGVARSLEECERLSPLLDRELRAWLDARRCDLACRLGDRAAALQYARKVAPGFRQTPSKFYQGLVRRLEGDAPLGKRVELAVRFVRQHHKTCSPATLASICRLWSMPGEHLEMAEEITYGGTPQHSERQWARDHGWFTKEFTVTWDAAVSLIDRGIAFTLTTSEVATSHLQAVIGYDSLRGTLIVRDPTERHMVEIGIDQLQERHRSTGPRGMALVPLAEKSRLEALSLPDETLFDHVDRLTIALQDFQRAQADQIVAAMSALNPHHLLTLSAQCTLAYSDGNLHDELMWTERLLKAIPGDPRLSLRRADCLRALGGRREERLAIFQDLCGRKEVDPACLQQYALELAADTRASAQAHAVYLLRRAMRLNPGAGATYETLARIRGDQRRFDQALELHAFAACLEGTNEYLANAYFQSARPLGKAAEAIEFLRHRFARFGSKSSLPARTLYAAYAMLEKKTEAYATLDKARELRPDDAELMLYVVDEQAAYGDFDAAAETLERARPIAKPIAWLRTAARLATTRGELAQSLEYWRQVIEQQPTDDAHRAYTQLLTQCEGRQATLRYLESACRRFPSHYGLRVMWHDWLRVDGPQACDKVLRGLLDAHPTDAWTRRELALNLADADRTDEGLEQVDEAERLDPHAPQLWSTKAFLLKKAKRFDDELAALRDAIRLSVDFQFAIQELIRRSETLDQRRDAMAFIEQELIRQFTLGDSILTFRDAGAATLPLDKFHASLQRVLEYRHDLWQAWSAVIRQLVYMERTHDAVNLARKASERFPQLAMIWLDRADAERAAKNAGEEIAALERAVELAPTWPVPRRALANAYELSEAADRSKALLDREIAAAPLVPDAYLALAELSWRQRQRDRAIDLARHALKLDFFFEPAWSLLVEWSAQLDRIDELITLVKNWTKVRPGEPRVWLRLAQAIQRQAPAAKSEEEKGRVEETVIAYDRALQLSPYGQDIHDLKAESLALAGRYDEAKAACNAPIWKGKPPLMLRGRSAWVRAADGDYGSAKEQMSKLVQEDPTYQWGWNQLAEWSLTSGEYQQYHDAAAEFLRTNPDSAAALTYRGEARLRMGARAAGLDDLRAAMRKDPCFAMAGFLLFDEQLTDNDLAGAEATLQSLLKNVGGEFVRARQIQLAAKRGAKEAALELFAELCRSRVAMNQALDMAMRAFDLADWKVPAEKILREAMQEKNWNLHLALLYAGRWNPNLANDLPERIAVLDRALEREPDAFYILDFKAELLTNGNLFERAIEVCNTTTLPHDQFALEGRSIWVQYRAGKATESIFAMRDLLRQHPKYYWGWAQLAEWYGQRQAWMDVLTIAEQLVLLAPKDPAGFGHRGLAKERLGDMQAARADYTHAMELSPTYFFAAWQLFDMHVRAAEWRKAEKVLEKVKDKADPGELALRKVDLLVYQNKKTQFPSEFENLCRNCAKFPFLLDSSLMLLMQAGWGNDAEPILHQCLDLGPHICGTWVRLHIALGRSNIGDVIQHMSPRRPERTNCVGAYAIELAYSKQRAGLRQWILTNEDCLRADTPNWALAGRALEVIQDWRGLAEWMSDWSSHPDAKPMHLIPLVRALRCLGHVEAARKVGLHALTKLQPDYASAFHKAWLVFDQAMNGELPAVKTYLDKEDQGGFDGYHRMLVYMIRALWLTLKDPATGFSEGRRFLAEATQRVEPIVHDVALSQAYQACISRMAAADGSFGAKVWRWWRWLNPLLPRTQQNA